MNINEYNGWTNYATWRVNLELFSDLDWKDLYDEFPNEEMLEDYVENVVFDNHYDNMGLMENYARAFLNNVNYYEILEHMRENYEHDKTTENENN
tara:strand:+ start:307 stop:591 length:285 start_codon:yes stop_codon:yes gene_type:complete